MTTTSRLGPIPDLQTGAAYLSRLSLANPALAEQQLLDFLDSLLETPPEASVLFTLLEQARVPLCFVEEERARLYHNKALALTEEEEACFAQVVSAWERMENAYALCARLHHPDENDPAYATLIATILHRCLYYTGMAILEHYRARREVPKGVWSDLNGYFDTAEQWGVIYNPVNDSLENNLQATHCAAAYVTVLMIDIAGPYSNSVRNLNLIRRWAGMWAPLVTLHPLSDELETPPYIIELSKDLPIHPADSVEEIGSDARRLDTGRLALQINHMLAQLHQKITPQQLGLGEETSGHVIQLLERLSRPWSQTASPRRFRRFRAEGQARVALGVEAMHYYISGKEFIQPDAASIYSRSDFDELFTFRDRAIPGQALSFKPHLNFPVEDWAVINHSANGFRLTRSEAGLRLAHTQLMAICPPDGNQFLLGQAAWLMQEQEGNLVVGMVLLPGKPEGIGVRTPSAMAGHAERFQRGFLLPPIPAVNEEGSLVIPPELYKASGALEIFIDGKSRLVRMKHIRQRGIDFDRITYDPL